MTMAKMEHPMLKWMLGHDAEKIAQDKWEDTKREEPPKLEPEDILVPMENDSVLAEMD